LTFHLNKAGHTDSSARERVYKPKSYSYSGGKESVYK
jgi:hypothetical protein